MAPLKTWAFRRVTRSAVTGGVLDRSALFPDGPQAARPGWQVREGVLDVAVGLLLDQQSHRGGSGALAPLPPEPWPYPHPGEPAGHLALVPTRR